MIKSPFPFEAWWVEPPKCPGEGQFSQTPKIVQILGHITGQYSDPDYQQYLAVIGEHCGTVKAEDLYHSEAEALRVTLLSLERAAKFHADKASDIRETEKRSREKYEAMLKDPKIAEAIRSLVVHCLGGDDQTAESVDG